jgi:Transglycosylase-like domain
MAYTPDTPLDLSNPDDWLYYATGVKGKESGGDPNAQNPNSSAGGLYQFTDGTWSKYGKGDKFDPAAQEQAMKDFTADNAKALQAQGIPVTARNLYVTHFLGSGDAPDVIKAPGTDASADYVQDGSVAANRSVFDKNPTVQSLLDWAGSRFGGTPGSSSGILNNLGGRNSAAAPPPQAGGLYAALTGGPGALTQTDAYGVSPRDNIESGLGIIASSLMARDNPSGASAISGALSSARNTDIQRAQLAMQKLKQAQQGDSVLYKGDKNLLMQRPDGSTYVRTTADLNEPDDGKGKYTAALGSQAQQFSKTMADNGHVINDINDIENFLIAHPDYNMSLGANGVYELKNRLGMADPETAEYKNIRQLIEKLKYATVMTEKGPVTAVKLIAGHQMNMPGGAENDPATFLQAVQSAKEGLRANFASAADGLKNLQNTTRGIDGTITTPKGDRKNVDDYSKESFDAWNKHDEEIGPQKQKFIQQHYSGGNKPTFKEFFKQ